MTDYRSPFREPQDELLAEVATRVQLRGTDYGEAERRYEEVRSHIERDGSPLKDRVVRFYPQGSMAIGAAIASGTSEDKFDVDAIADLRLSPAATAREVLNDLYRSIKGKPGSRYYATTERHTRCVTVRADNMHLDVTPMRPSPGKRKREGRIFHHQEASSDQGVSLVANPYGFAEWFKERCQEDLAFAKAAREHDFYRRVLAEAEVEPLPDSPYPWMSPRVVVLQLLKRWRNIQYEERSEERVPPSVVLAKLVAQARIAAPGLSGMLLEAARHILGVLDEAKARGDLVREENPVCPKDVLTDRWPRVLAAQTLFTQDVRALVRDLEKLVAGTLDLEEMQRLLVALFGERPATSAVRAYMERTGDAIRRGESRHTPGAGRIVPAGAAVIGTARPTRGTPRHNFYGNGA